jgi:predicted secreted hydrolase
MAHKRKGRTEPRRPSQKSKDEPRGSRVIVAMIVVVILILVPLALLLSSQDSSDTPPEPEFKITFPRDEGQHNESTEFWKVDFLLKDQVGNKFDFNIDYYLHETGQQERIVTVTDAGNISGREFFVRAYEGSLGIGYEKLNLTFDSTSGSDTWNGVYTDPYEYSYEGQVFDSGQEVYYLDLGMTSVKDPLLLGDKGVVTLESGGNALGTIKGYLITRLDVTGTMRLSGTTYTVNGYAWMEHEWGAWTVRDMEEFRLQMSTASELFLVRFFDRTDHRTAHILLKPQRTGDRAQSRGLRTVQSEILD